MHGSLLLTSTLPWDFCTLRGKLKEMMEQLAVFNASESLASFNARTQGYSSVVANEISTQLALWNGALYTE